MVRTQAWAAMVVLLSASSVAAQGDAEAGHDLVQRWCTSCHVVDHEGRGTDAAPPLPGLLASGARTPDHLRIWLSDPHPPMPNLDLSRQEIENIVAYLESLQAR